MGEDDVYEIIPLEPRFESLCPRCHLVYPTAIGCETDSCQAKEVPVRHLRLVA